MNNFVAAYTDKIREISNESDLRNLCRWLYGHQAEVATTAESINSTLGLRGRQALQPDLPCPFVGHQAGLMVLAANPGWHPDINPIEDAYCRTSPEAYEDLLFNFFESYPRITNKRSRWWSGPMSFAPLLESGSEKLQGSGSAASRWQAVHKSGLLGGWDLFPWHSSSDGLSPFISESVPWLYELCRASVEAVLRFNPQVLLVASKVGYQLIRRELLRDLPWRDFDLGQKIKVPIAYTRLTSGSEVVTIGRQIFSSPRDFTNLELFRRIRQIRAAC